MQDKSYSFGSSILKKIIGGAFLLMIGAGAVFGGGWKYLPSLIPAGIGKSEGVRFRKPADQADNELTSSLPVHSAMIDMNGELARALNMQGLYSSMGLYVTDDRRTITAEPITSTDYEVSQMEGLSDFLNQNGVKLLYVNQPVVYTDDGLFEREFGTESWCNRNADTFLSRIREEGISAVDLRDSIKEEGLNTEDMFYRTDHHWTTETGLWAAGKIAEGLNQYCGYQIDPATFSRDRFTFTDYPQSWLGEQGKKIGRTYVGLDDYVEIRPNFDTAYTFRSGGKVYGGTFDDFIRSDRFKPEEDYYNASDWYYAYRTINCTNQNVRDGNVLLLCDSYAQVTDSFLSLGLHNLDTITLREYPSDFKLEQYILDQGYDTVVIAYAQFMIGAHDDPTSANYKMFALDR